MKYYVEKYNRPITNVAQPLIISLPKMREERSKVSGPIYLIPELCNMTMLSNEQQANFDLMKSVDDYTGQDSVKQTNTLLKFAERLNGTKEIAEDLQGQELNGEQRVVPKDSLHRLLVNTIIGGKPILNYTELMHNYRTSAFLLQWNRFTAL